jgi:hypothetical protein
MGAKMLQKRLIQAGAALLGALSGFYVAVLQVGFAMTHRLPDTYYDANAVPRFPYAIFTDPTSTLGFIVENFFLINPGGAVVGGLLVLRQYARQDPDKNLADFMCVGFALGWLVLGWPLTFSGA